MPTPPKPESASTSWLVQFRVNAKTPVGRQVLDLLEAYNERGYTDREVLIEALLAFGEQDFPRRTDLDDLASYIHELGATLTENQIQIYNALESLIQDGSLADYTNAEGRSLDEVIGDQIPEKARRRMLGGMQNRSTS